VYGNGPLGLAGPEGVALLVVVGLPLVLALSYLFYWYCERPFVRSGLKAALKPKMPARAVIQ
ncbi:MAG: hypothetical protein ICV83_35815, partial [Cytophagales bacterium]|nr:hypothetical protein [Cytophagales bacterium]